MERRIRRRFNRHGLDFCEPPLGKTTKENKATLERSCPEKRSLVGNSLKGGGGDGLWLLKKKGGGERREQTNPTGKDAP